MNDDTVTGQGPINCYPEASQEERVRADAILRDGRALRRIWFSGPSVHSCESSRNSDIATIDTGIRLGNR